MICFTPLNNDTFYLFFVDEMAHKKSSDDIDLSLTGSQISARSSSRPLSAGQMKRPNSLGDVRKTKVLKE